MHETDATNATGANDEREATDEIDGCDATDEPDGHDGTDAPEILSNRLNPSSLMLQSM